MKKAVWVVNIDNFLPLTTKYTFKTIAYYANKIGADFNIITKRKFPDFPPTYEKLQIYELGKGYDWNVLIDADMLIHPFLWDITKIVPTTKVGFYAAYDVRQWFEIDDYFLRDERFLGIASNFIAINKICHDFWTPFEMSYNEIKNKSRRYHGIEDYCFARNLARFGLKEFNMLTQQDIHLIRHLCASGENKQNTDIELEEQAKKTYKLWGIIL